MNPDSEPASPAAIAGGFGALAACCAVKVLIIGGVVAGASGAAIGGIALAAGLAAAAVAWLAVSLLRRRARASTRASTGSHATHPGGDARRDREDRPAPLG